MKAIEDVDSCLDSSVSDISLITNEAMLNMTPNDLDNYNFTDCKTCVRYDEIFLPTILDNTGIQTLFATLYSLVWFVGLIGNGMVLVVVAVSAYVKYRYGNTERIGKINPTFPVRSVFVVSLACSDLLITMTSLPITAVNSFSHIWIFPDFVCHSVGFLQAFSIFQSSFTFTSIAVDRCLLITRPKRVLVTYRLARFIVFCTSLLAVGLASPMAFVMGMEELKPVCGRFCVENWPSKGLHSAYGVCVILLQLALPSIVTGVCYSIIGYRLKQRQRNRFRRGSGGPPTPARWRATERRQRTNRMMAMMVAAFVLFYAPFNLINLLRDLNLSVDLFQKNKPRSGHFHLLYAIAHLLAMASVVWNPIMYAWYNESIRNVLRPALKFFRRQQSRPVPMATINEYDYNRCEE